MITCRKFVLNILILDQLLNIHTIIKYIEMFKRLVNTKLYFI